MATDTPARNEIDVPVADALEHGYRGRSQDPTERSAYTLAGLTGQPAPKVTDKPKSAAKYPVKRPSAKVADNR